MAEGLPPGSGNEPDIDDAERIAPPVADQVADGTALVRALRRAGDEAQLTQAIAAVAAADADFARGFVVALLEAAVEAGNAEPVRRLRGGGLPQQILCRAEASLSGDSGGLGRVDLLFSGDDVTLLVENKLGSWYGHRQLERYLRALDSLPSDGRAGLVAITRNVPTHGEQEVANDPRWLGSIRWAALLGGLRELAISDRRLGEQWHALLDVLEEDGDLGTMKPDAELIRSWAAYLYGRSHLVDHLDQIWPPLLEHLCAELKSNYRTALPGEELAALRTEGKRRRAVKTDQSNVYLRFRVPKSSKMRDSLQIGFEAHDGEPYFTVWVAPADAGKRLSSGDAQLRRAVRELERLGFAGIGYPWWAKSLAPEEFLEEKDLPSRLLDFGRERIAEIAASGILKTELDRASTRRARRTSARKPQT